jgi:hypothetical protein
MPDEQQEGHLALHRLTSCFSRMHRRRTTAELHGVVVYFCNSDNKLIDLLTDGVPLMLVILNQRCRNMDGEGSIGSSGTYDPYPSKASRPHPSVTARLRSVSISHVLLISGIACCSQRHVDPHPKGFQDSDPLTKPY